MLSIREILNGSAGIRAAASETDRQVRRANALLSVFCLLEIAFGDNTLHKHH